MSYNRTSVSRRDAWEACNHVIQGTFLETEKPGMCRRGENLKAAHALSFDVN